MLKKFLIFFTIFIALMYLAVSIPFSVTHASVSQDNLIDEIEKLVGEKGGKVLTEDEFYKELGISKSEANIDKRLEFDNLEEFKAFLNKGGFESAITDADNNTLDSITPSEILSNESNTFGNYSPFSTYNSSHVWSRWNPIGYPDLLGPIGTTFTWKKVSFNYSYKYVGGKRRFTSVSNLKSYIKGINTIQWKHRVGHYNFSTTNSYRDTVRFTITGHYYYGFSVGGTVIGISTPDETWTGGLRLK